MPVTNPASKVQITRNPAIPASCIICGIAANGTNEFIDFNFSIDYYGAVLFCVDCAREVAVAIDYIPVADREEERKQLAVLHARIQEVQTENGKLNATLDSLLNLRPDLRSGGSRPLNMDGTDSKSAESGTSKASSGPAKPSAK